MSEPEKFQEEPKDDNDSVSIPVSAKNNDLIKSVPFEPALLKAFEKLTNQILIFLLAYVILIIGLGVFANELSETLKNLLYIIPIIGAGTYLLSRERKISKDAEEQGINVKAGWVSGNAKVIGVRTSSKETTTPDNVNVEAGVVKDEAEIIAFVVENNDPAETLPGDIGYLTEMFQQLNSTNRRKLISSGQRYLDKQENYND